MTFAEYTAAEGISNSMLKDIGEPNTPAHFHAKHIAKWTQQEDTPALGFGRAFHCATLEQELFDDLYVVKPEGLSLATKDGKAWRSQWETQEVLSFEDGDRILRMRTSVTMHPDARRILKGAQV